ncbi:MAG TPA: STAS domain-containing protein [Acidimicrobiia bacterium]|nr:STAS domain-containing protein [Acidimicrobiia bacterium]
MTTGPKYRIDVDSEGPVRRVIASGEIDLASAGELETALTAEPEATVIADLSDVGFIDSTGLRSLLSSQEAVTNAGGRLLLVFDDGPVERILNLTRLTDRFEVHSDVEAATRAVL